jgi:hypothetical protein
MTDTTVIEEQTREDVVVGQPTATPAPEQSIDDLLADYDRQTATPEPASVGDGTNADISGNVPSDQTFDQQLADLLDLTLKLLNWKAS